MNTSFIIIIIFLFVIKKLYTPFGDEPPFQVNIFSLLCRAFVFGLEKKQQQVEQRDYRYVRCDERVPDFPDRGRGQHVAAAGGALLLVTRQSDHLTPGGGTRTVV